ncbi:MAG TPA: hypothetical protein VN026_18600, partial [Bacteroidia bacterium]|nr:hypothetical protein [Bacteroidia bacterium]
PINPADKEYYQKSAGRWVRKINIGLKFVLKPSYKAAMLNNGDERKCKDFWEENKNRTKRQVENEASNDPDLYKAFLRYAAYKEEEKRIPLDKDESEELIESLADYLEEIKKTKPSAGSMLALSVLAIVCTRLEPFFPGLMEKLFGK